MSDLPMEVTADILSRLPVKPLLRFRSVSKLWCSLIDSPVFIKSHLNRSIETNDNLSIILRDCYLYSIDFNSLDRAIELDHPLKSNSCGTEVLGSFHGLLCLSNSEEEIVLWNPSTRKHRKLPVAPIEFPPEFTFPQFFIYGLGYDSVSDDYKLVRIVQFYGIDHDSFDSEVKVYSLKSNSWRRIQDFPYYLLYKRVNAAVVNGALHWVVSRKPESDTANLIAAFDLGVEEYRLVPQPDYLDKDFHMNVGVLGGCLYVMCNYVGERVDIWVMKEYGVKESWTKLFSVEQPSVVNLFDFVKPLAFSMNGEEILLDQDGVRLLWFDLKRKTLKNVRIQGVPSLFEPEMCLGSLVPLQGDDGEKQQAQKKMKKKDRKGRDDFTYVLYFDSLRDDFLSKGFKLKL
ncbi:F-box protein CPR1-like [Cornus florida]|uniref:F-box protein CPR1-like n=1 Tax=Cornus florida TaxID=4283 RepID=UPI0028996D17|nr:F-box protein CPR1-like [Cornus florida]